MALIDEVKSEIMQRLGRSAAKHVDPPDQQAPTEQPKRRRRRKNPENMTKEELEAYKQKMMEKEEEKYLGPLNVKKARKRRRKNQDKEELPIKDNGKQEKRAENLPKMLQPLQPLYILKVPGLPKGDALVVCLAHGVEQ